MALTIIREIRPVSVAGPVRGSRVTWRSRDDACEVSAETSLDGEDWLPATDGGPVPGLNLGDHPELVHARVTMRWADDYGRKEFPLPSFRVDLSCQWGDVTEDVGAALVGGSETGGN